VETGGHVVETDPIHVFGNELRAQRERAGLTQKELADKVYCSASLLSAIENTTRLAQRDLVEKLDEVLRTGGTLLRIWGMTTKGTYPSWFAKTAELEVEATKIHEWELRYVPGLLQTPDYAREVMRANRPRNNVGDDDESIERDVTARIDRQDILTRDNPPRAWFVIDESILHRIVGDDVVMAKQLEHLENMAEPSNIVIQILPFEARVHPGGEGPLKILEFSDNPTIGYTEGYSQDRQLDVDHGLNRDGAVEDL
jgi:transcriptional regulator with XRE-family HTH domain